MTSTRWTIVVSFRGTSWDWKASDGKRYLFCPPTSAPWTRRSAKREALAAIRALDPKPMKKPVQTVDTREREYVVWQ